MFIHNKIMDSIFEKIFNKKIKISNVKSEIFNDTSNDISNDISKYMQELNDNGYTVVPNVYNEYEITDYWNEFNKWREAVPNLDNLHNIIDYNGIYKHHQVGHQRFAWLARTNPKVLNVFTPLKI